MVALEVARSHFLVPVVPDLQNPLEDTGQTGGQDLVRRMSSAVIFHESDPEDLVDCDFCKTENEDVLITNTAC